MYRYLNHAKNNASIQRISNHAKNKASIQRISNVESDRQIPRRASKRLAGIKADPLLELKPTRAHRDVAKQSGDDKACINADRSIDSLPNDHGDVDKQSGENKAGINADRSTNILPNDQTKQLNTVQSTENTMGNNATDKECVKVIENKDNVDVKLDYTDEFPLKEILTDPCIAFAIQTLTGNSFETLKDAQTSASAEECDKKINVTNDHPTKFAVAEIDKAGSCSEKKHDISKKALSSVNLCKNDYNCSQIFGKESRNVC